jgi:proline iminopeptidase
LNRVLFRLLALCLFSAGLFSCSKNDSSGPPATSPLGPPRFVEVNRENYLNGQQFCEVYKSITSKEYGTWITVPVDYKNPASGELKIYVYTLSPFDPLKPSYIFIDGGPGQNTHGEMPEFLSGRYNEFRFDQRGVGCSAPATYDLYLDPKNYSDLNTVQDMESIRKHFNVKTWSLYGLSYGTQPATIYASIYPQVTRSVLLEGVVSSKTPAHSLDYKAEKMNLVLDLLNQKQRQAFSELVGKDSEDSKFVLALFMNFFYFDRGMQKMALVLKKLINENGELNQDYLNALKYSSAADPHNSNYAQRPGVIDETIIGIISCKNRNFRNWPSKRIFYSSRNGFYTQAVSNEGRNNLCDQLKVSVNDTETFDMTQYPLLVPTYYFQGSHDGATHAKGALEHWKATSFSEKSYFMLSRKGGHNPLLSQLFSYNLSAKSAQLKIFEKALMGQSLKLNDLVEMNQILTESSKWILLPAKESSFVFAEAELQGISLASGSRSAWRTQLDLLD